MSSQVPVKIPLMKSRPVPDVRAGIPALNGRQQEGLSPRAIRNGGSGFLSRDILPARLQSVFFTL
jgi:hypothetical protein